MPRKILNTYSQKFKSSYFIYMYDKCGRKIFTDIFSQISNINYDIDNIALDICEYKIRKFNNINSEYLQNILKPTDIWSNNMYNFSTNIANYSALDLFCDLFTKLNNNKIVYLIRNPINLVRSRFIHFEAHRRHLLENSNTKFDNYKFSKFIRKFNEKNIDIHVVLFEDLLNDCNLTINNIFKFYNLPTYEFIKLPTNKEIEMNKNSLEYYKNKFKYQKHKNTLNKEIKDILTEDVEFLSI